MLVECIARHGLQVPWATGTSWRNRRGIVTAISSRAGSAALGQHVADYRDALHKSSLRAQRGI
jgi:hypothetical protein